MNIIGTKKVLDLCKKMTKLVSFVHVSTAYANCNRSSIAEEIYPPSIDPENIIEFTNWLSDDMAVKLTPSLIQSWPNTYTFTKAIAETLVKQECESHGISCAIVRPSIVGATWKEPFSGWVDSFSGSTVVLAAAGKGVLRTMYGDPSANAEVIPVDICVNMIVVACWEAATRTTNEITVFNNTMGDLNPLNWKTFIENCKSTFKKYPLDNTLLPPQPYITLNRTWNKTRHVVEELLPAYLSDMYLKLAQKKPKFVRMQNKLCQAVEVLEYFISHKWVYTNDNVLKIKTEMNRADQIVNLN